MSASLGLTTPASGVTPASGATQQLLHCVFVTMAAGFDYIPGIFTSLFSRVISVGDRMMV